MSPGKIPYLPQDFTACTNKICHERQNCWRAWPSPDAKHQSYGHFTNPPDRGGCEHRLDMPKERPWLP